MATWYAKRAVFVAAALTVAAVSAAFLENPLRGWFGARNAGDTLLVSGNIEAHESVLSFTQVQGPIVYLPSKLLVLDSAMLPDAWVLFCLDQHRGNPV